MLAAWGTFWPKLTQRIRSRRELSDFCVDHNGTAGAVQCLQVPPERWWATLADARFALNPTGNGLQSPKWIEEIAHPSHAHRAFRVECHHPSLRLTLGAACRRDPRLLARARF